MNQPTRTNPLARAAAGVALAVIAATTAVLAVGPGARAQDLPKIRRSDRKPVTQKMVFANYFYAYQGDTRKPVPTRGIRSEKGQSQLTNHPWESVGPWMSYDRAQWHKNQFQMMAAGGVDVALTVYRGDKDSRHTYAIKGLDVMSQGLKELRSDGLAPLMRVREYPQVGLALDLGGLSDQYGGPVDLKDPEVQKSLFGMVRDFYSHIPEEFRATFQLPPSRLTPGETTAVTSTPNGAAYMIRLLNDAAVKDADNSVLQYVNRRFAQEFGVRLIWLGTPDLKKKIAGLDGTAPYPAATQPGAVTDDGWLRVGSFGPGYDDTALSENGAIRPRENGQQLIVDFRKIIAANPDWVIIDSWNNYNQGTDVAPTLEYGLLYRDLIRAAVLEYKQTADFAVNFLKASAPRVLQPGAIYQVDVVLQNSGTYDWDILSGAALSYRWLKGGKYVGEVGNVIPIGGLMRGEKKTFLIGVNAPVKEGQVLGGGEYELEFNLNRRVGEEVAWFDQEETAPYRMPVTIGPAPQARPFWVNSTMPTLVKRDGVYPVTVRIRNDGNETWKKGVVSLGYRWRKVSTYLKGLGGDSDTVVVEGSKRVALAADVGPGRLISVDVPVATTDAAGQGLVPWSAKEDWAYALEWDVYDGKQYLSAAGGSTFRETVQVLDRDPAPSFIGCNLPSELTGGVTGKVTVGLFNVGPDTWKKERDKVVVHWYYMDGTEASWNDTLLPLQEDVPPFSKVETDVPDDLAEKLLPDEVKKKTKKGEKKKTHKEMLVQPTVLRDVLVRVPYYFGPMYCVFDFQHEGVNASTSAASKGNDLLVIPVNVYSPTFTPLPVMAYYNVDGMSQDVDRGDGNIDGRGNSLPVEFMPPYVPRPSVGTNPAPNPLYPSGLWVNPLNDLNSSRVCFLYPAKNNQAPNMMACQGQKMVFGAQERTAVHFLALSTAGGAAGLQDATGDFVLSYADGTKEIKKLTFSHWNDPPKHGERVAFSVPHRHTATGDDPSTRCYINHYTLPVERLKQLIGIEFPRLPAVKVIAVTLESAGVKAP